MQNAECRVQNAGLTEAELGYRVSDDEWDGVERTCVDCGTAFVMAVGENPRWCPGCGRIFGRPRTREERIKAMRLEELARLVSSSDAAAERYCKGRPECQAALDRGEEQDISEEMCLECIRAWLLEETSQAE